MSTQSLPVHERRKGTAVWKQVEQVLIGEIWSGQFVPGDKLPSEAALAERFGVNRHTIRRTLAELVSNKIVRVENGRGAFVRQDVLNYQLASSTRFWEAVALGGQSPSVELISSGVAPASGAVAHVLQIDDGIPTVFLDSIGRANGEPVLIARHSFPMDRFPDLIERYQTEGSIRAALLSYGVHSKRQRVRVMARMPDQEETEVFGLPHPILVVESTYVDQAGAPVDFGASRYASGRVQLDIELDESVRNIGAEVVNPKR
ncbi:phosphonate metabolism transcriptional regulator PhnF [Bradyrhizobium sp. LTSP857]|uniref:phosphonate metabolism transcriptional regulator PhnF n=1 Tax=Bradyrhizobium sp. LTSP857 TaxID=1619231 RepID=UPI0005D2AC9B|nr:phosphonate metabolism transcriptional regulator PhnF [Bradyrhizobium sp. LTSP857]